MRALFIILLLFTLSVSLNLPPPTKVVRKRPNSSGSGNRRPKPKPPKPPSGDDVEEALEEFEEDMEDECFPYDATVTLRNGTRQMKDLQVGDEIYVGDGRYERVFGFSHRERTGWYEFVQLEWREGNIRVSKGHLVYVEGEVKEARRVKVGDRLMVEGDGRVIGVKRVRGWGLYNPHTEGGRGIVDGVSVSWYTRSVQENAAHALLAPVRAIMLAWWRIGGLSV